MKIFISFLLLLSLASSSQAQASAQQTHIPQDQNQARIQAGQEARPLRVFFIGNSFTDANYLPDVLQALATANDKPLQIGAELRGGTSLFQHWARGAARQKLSQDSWDILVLQDASASALEHPDKTLQFGAAYAQFMAKRGGRTLLFNTWAYDGIPTWVEGLEPAERQAMSDFIPGMYDKTNALYASLAQESGAEVVPVGQAWHSLATAAPGIVLYASDRSHPSPLGTYFSALVFYQALFGELPQHLPAPILSKRNHERPQEKVEIVVPPALAQQMLSVLASSENL